MSLTSFEEEYLKWKAEVEKRLSKLEKVEVVIPTPNPKPEPKSYLDKLESIQKDGFLEVGKYDIKSIYKIGEFDDDEPVYLLVFEDDNSRVFEPYNSGVDHWSLEDLGINSFKFAYKGLYKDLDNDPNMLSRESFTHPVLNLNMGNLPKEEPKPEPIKTGIQRGVNIWGGFGDYKDDQSDLSFNYNQERMFLNDLPYRNQRPWYAVDVAPYKVPHHNQLLAEDNKHVTELATVNQKWIFGEKEASELYQQFIKAKINYATFLCYNEGCMVTMRDQFINYIEKNDKDFQYYFTISFDKNRKDVLDFVASKMKTKWYKTVNGKPCLECFTDSDDFQKGIDVKNILKSEYGIEVYLIANENIGLSNVNRLKGNYDCVTKYYNSGEIGSQRPNAIFDGTQNLREEHRIAKENGLDYLPIVSLGLDRSARNAQWKSGVTWWYDHESVIQNLPKMITLCNELAHPELGWRASHLDENSEQGKTCLMNKKIANGDIDTTMIDEFAKY